jgi:hypothetical protein
VKLAADSAAARQPRRVSALTHCESGKADDGAHMYAVAIFNEFLVRSRENPITCNVMGFGTCLRAVHVPRGSCEQQTGRVQPLKHGRLSRAALILARGWWFLLVVGRDFSFRRVPDDDRDSTVTRIFRVLGIAKGLVGKSSHLSYLVNAHSTSLHKLPGGVGSIRGQLPIAVVTAPRGWSRIGVSFDQDLVG